MASQNAKKAAEKVLERIGKGKKIVLGEILREVGYADNTADNPLGVTETQTFKDTVAPTVKRLEGIRNKLISALEQKDMSEEKAKDAVDMMSKITHDIQLLSGKATEKTDFSLSDLSDDELVKIREGN